MFKKLLLLALSMGLGAAALHAQVTINANGLAPNKVLASDGSVLAVGDLVRLGYFSSTANLGTDNTFSDLNSIFTPIGEGLANSGTLSETNNSSQTIDINNVQSVPGQFAAGFNNVGSNYLPTGTLLYMWVFNSSVASTATQWGIYQAPSWMFPASLGTTTMSLGSANVNVIRGSTSGSNFELANVSPIPEPSAFVLVASGMVLGVAVLRRRR